MDTTIYAVPQLMNRLNELNHFLNENSSHISNLSLKEIMKLNSLVEILKNVDSSRLTVDMDISLKEDKNFNEENPNLQNEVKLNFQKLDTSLKNYLTLLDKFNSGEKVIKEDLDRSYKTLSIHLDSFESKAIDALSEMLGSRISNIKSSRTKTMSAGVLAVLMALAISYFITKSIKLDLNSLVLKLSSSSEDVESTSLHSMEISSKLSTAVTEQASSVQEISATTEEISQMTQKNNDNVKVSMQATVETVNTVNHATGLMDELDIAILNLKIGNDQIIARSNLNSKNFESIIGIIKSIEDKTKVINDIVFQTKLLSFNASVEAARAGEQGKGFSVVADEVGNLAKMSGQAAQEITELLEGSLKKVRELTVEADFEIKKVVDVATSNISSVSQKVSLCQNSNKDILKNSDKITSLINEVVIASEEQTKGVMEITKAIGSFDVVTNQNAHLANELNSSAKLLSEKSSDLKEIIGSLIRMSGIKS
jgi:methyl-accepting chemotaxis protein